LLCFVTLYLPRFRRDFIPFTLFGDLYDLWVREQASLGVPRYPSTHNHFPRQLRQAVDLVGGWRKATLPTGQALELMVGDEPLARLVDWKLPEGKPTVSGYARLK